VRRDEGAATPLVLGLACVLGAVAVLLTAVSLVAVTRHRAAAAADQAALAAATTVLEGPVRACAVAAAVADEHGAALTGCAVVGQEVEVSVAVRASGPLSGLGQVRARARAGPAGPDRTTGAEPPGPGTRQTPGEGPFPA